MGSLALVVNAAGAAGENTPDRGQQALALGTKRRYTLGGMNTSAKSVAEKEKAKLVKRLSRIRGQVDALQRALIEQDAPSAKLLQQATACRGAMDGFIAEVIEDHIREHVIDPTKPKDDPHSQAADELIDIVHAYIT